MSERPATIKLGRIRARAVRGPRADGAWYWQARTWRDGAEHTIWVGWAHREAAEDFLLTNAAALLEARSSASPEIATLEHLLRAWLAWQQDRAGAGEIRPRTAAIYKMTVKRLVKLGGMTRLEHLNHHVVSQVRIRAMRLYAPKTVDLDLRLLAMALRWGEQLGLVVDPPEVPRLSRDRVKERVLCHRTPTPADVAATLAAIDLPWLRLTIQILWTTGARIGEVSHLRPEDYDRTDHTLVFRGKTGPREVPVPDHLAAELDAWEAGEEWLLGVRPITVESNCRRGINTATRQAGVTRWTPHGLRRLAVDSLARAGVDVATAADLLGHSPQTMWDHYRRVSELDKRRALAVAGLGQAPEGRVLDLAGTRTGTADR